MVQCLMVVYQEKLLQSRLDGYSAPLTTGNFAKLVVNVAYDVMKLKCTDQAILSDSGIDKSIGYSVPLEIMPFGQLVHFVFKWSILDLLSHFPYIFTCSKWKDEELPVLPLSVYGAVAMAMLTRRV